MRCAGTVPSFRNALLSCTCPTSTSWSWRSGVDLLTCHPVVTTVWVSADPAISTGMEQAGTLTATGTVARSFTPSSSLVPATGTTGLRQELVVGVGVRMRRQPQVSAPVLVLASQVAQACVRRQVLPPPVEALVLVVARVRLGVVQMAGVGVLLAAAAVGLTAAHRDMAQGFQPGPPLELGRAGRSPLTLQRSISWRRWLQPTFLASST